MADTKLSRERERGGGECARAYSLAVGFVNLIDCAEPTWALYSHPDFDERGANREAEVMMD